MENLTDGQRRLLSDAYTLWSKDYRFRDALFAAGMAKYHKIEGEEDLVEERLELTDVRPLLQAMIFWKQAQLKIDEKRQALHQARTAQSNDLLRDFGREKISVVKGDVPALEAAAASTTNEKI